MISNYEQILEVINAAPCGDSKFKLILGECSIQIKPQDKFEYKQELMESEYWLYNIIGHAISRSFCANDKKWIPKKDTPYKIKNAIMVDILDTIRKCSNSKMGERTSLYKEYRTIINKYDSNINFINNILPILNYYHSTPTDETCKSNVIGLLTLLRKKYAAPSRD